MTITNIYTWQKRELETGFALYPVVNSHPVNSRVATVTRIYISLPACDWQVFIGEHKHVGRASDARKACRSVQKIIRQFATGKCIFRNQHVVEA